MFERRLTMFGLFNLWEKQLEVGDIFYAPVNGEASKNGFSEYAEPEDVYEVIDKNRKGYMVIRYKVKPYQSLEKGFKFPELDFKSTSFISYKLRNKTYIKSDYKSIEEFLANN